MEGIASVATAESRKLGTQLENLPDVLLLHILSFLPTKDVVRNSSVAKRWQNFWKFVSHVDIEERGEYIMDLRNPKNEIPLRVSFINFVENVLLKRDSSNIDYFTLSLCILSDASRINSWIFAALTHKVQKLCLKLRRIIDNDFELPSCLFTCQFLTQLKIDMISDLRLPTMTLLPGLEELELQGVTLPGDSSIMGLFSGCPNLKKLSLKYCNWSKVRAICISAPRLEELIITEKLPCNFRKASQVVILAADLKLFSFTGGLRNDYYIDSPALTEGFINLHLNEDRRSEREYAYRMHKLLRQLAGVKRLSISPETLEVLDCAKDLLAHLPSFGRLDSLYLVQSPTDFPSEALWTILRKSPRLALLDFCCGFWAGDSEGTPVINPVPSCFSTHLKTIRIWLHEEEEEEEDLYFLSELLRVGSVLEGVYLEFRVEEHTRRHIKAVQTIAKLRDLSLATQHSLKSSKLYLSCNSASHSSWPN